MRLEDGVGQLLWCGWGEEPETDPRSCNDHCRLLLELGVGGLILFPRNLGSPAEIAALTADLRRRAPIPPLIGVDQEGGRVSRLRLPGMVFCGNQALGRLDRPDRTREVNRAIGEQLAALGIDTDFAPVADVNNNPANPVIGDRSFGDDPALVARHVTAALAGLREAGVLSVAKHFPGHGDTGTDSHLALPVLPASRARLDAVELVPFRAAIREGCPALMSAHILFPELDSELPATLSPAVLTGLLREELGFEGLVVTDCLEMRGVADHWGPEEAAVRAVEAGADMLLVCHTWETQSRMHAALRAAVREGRLSEERVHRSVDRIRRARERIRTGLPDLRTVSAGPYRELEERIAEDCRLSGPEVSR